MNEVEGAAREMCGEGSWDVEREIETVWVCGECGWVEGEAVSERPGGLRVAVAVAVARAVVALVVVVLIARLYGDGSIPAWLDASSSPRLAWLAAGGGAVVIARGLLSSVADAVAELVVVARGER